MSLNVGHSMTDREEIRKIIAKENSTVYFIGIGGISMSSLAMMTLGLSKKVFGSDIKRSAVTDHLQSRGVRIKYTHSRANIMEIMPSLAVYSLSVKNNNPELVAARSMGIPAVSRAEYLGALMEDYSVRIGVSGSHGKSTACAMVGSVLSYASLSPTILCGAEISDAGGYVDGDLGYLVYEACEYGDSFLRFTPDIQIMLNLDFDHPDYFEDLESMKRSFLAAANLAKGAVIINTDDPDLESLVTGITAPVITFGSSEGADYRYSVVSIERGRATFDLFFEQKLVSRFTLSVAGEFNVINATAAIIAARMLGVSDERIREGIEKFSGIKRRFEYLGNHAGIDLYYDYAHHPAEIEATEHTLRSMGYKSVCAVFSPHTYSRTKALFDGFVRALSKFEAIYITDIYGAREDAVVGVSAMALANAIKAAGGSASSLANECAVKDIILGNYDALVLMGAGDLDSIKREAEKL